MKKIIIPFLVLVLVSSVVVAQQQGVDEPETGMGSPGLNESGQSQQVQAEQETQNEGEEETLMIQQRVQLKARNTTELRQMIQERQQEMVQEMQTLRQDQQQVYQNQNKVRLAVHSLLAMEDLTGGIGRNVSQIAREFNNSVQATIRAEQRIETRNMVVKFLFGGDEVAAEEMEQEVIQNQQRIQHLRQLMNQCDCEEQVRAMLQEQIQNMEQEQTRLQQLAQNEKGNKGLFGWLWK